MPATGKATHLIKQGNGPTPDSLGQHIPSRLAQMPASLRIQNRLWLEHHRCWTSISGNHTGALQRQRLSRTSSSVRLHQRVELLVVLAHNRVPLALQLSAQARARLLAWTCSSQFPYDPMVTIQGFRVSEMNAETFVSRVKCKPYG